MIEILYDDSFLGPEDGRPLYRVEMLHGDGTPHVYRVFSDTRDANVTGRRRGTEPELVRSGDKAFERLYCRLHKHLQSINPLPVFDRGSPEWEKACLIFIEQNRQALAWLYSRGFEERSA